MAFWSTSLILPVKSSCIMPCLMAPTLSRRLSKPAMSRAARRCTTAAEESCTTGTMRKD